MENKNDFTQPLPRLPDNILKKYSQLTSPLVSLQSAMRQEHLRSELKTNVSMKLETMKSGRGSKIYALNNSTSFSQLKANAVFYQIPEFSSPEINFEVSELIKKKVQDAKCEIISNLPVISQSSNYAPKKLEHQLNHRTIVRQLEQWLRVKLKNPPQNYQQSIEYKNMIMGIGMKQLIRIISKRCGEEGRMAEEIWELTWSICREIILYLSKRARKCQELLDEEIKLMKITYEKQYVTTNAQNQQMKAKILSLQEQNKQLLTEISKLKKRRNMLEQQNKTLSFDNFHIKGEFKNILEENLAMYLQVGDKNKRGWIKKMYKKIHSSEEQPQKSTFKEHFKDQISQVIQNRIRQEEVTGDCQDPIETTEIEAIGTSHQLKQKRKRSKKTKKTKSKKSKIEGTMMTEINAHQQTNQNYIQDQEQDDKYDDQDDECNEMMRHMEEQFRTIETYVQTEQPLLIHAYASTSIVEVVHQSVEIDQKMFSLFEEYGVNTDQIKEQPKTLKKKGKQNEPMSKPKQKSKVSNAALTIRQKSKNKLQKSIMIDGVFQQSRLSRPSLKFYSKDESVMIKENLVENNRFSQSMDVRLGPMINFAEKNISFQQQVPKTNKSKVVTEINQNSSELMEKIMERQQIKQPLTTRNEVNSKQTKEEINQRAIKSISIEQQTADNKITKKQAQIDTIKDCNMYICAECNKIITAFDEKYYKKTKFELNSTTIEDTKPYRDKSPRGSSKLEDIERVMKKPRSQKRKNSSFLHDIGFKNAIQQQKIAYYNSNDSSKKLQEPFSIYTKIRPYKLLITSLQQANNQFIQDITSNQIQGVDNLENYFEMVRQINSMDQSKINMSDKFVISIIEKNIFPILNELLVNVKKAAKLDRIGETMKTFTSLPSIIYNRINRKYGVKILAIKNIKIILMALRAANKFSNKYKIIELMMFTDCKSPQSQDLFIYLLIMSMMDPNFSSTKILTQDELYTVRKLCQDHLTKEACIYQQFDKSNREQIEKQFDNNLLLSDVIKSLITNYRISKINKIQQLGFIFLMLKKDNYLDYKLFVFFLSTIAIDNIIKLQICKSLLEFCDVKYRDQRIGISENMFSRFMMSCDALSLRLLDDTLKQQLKLYNSKDKQTTAQLTNRFFETVKKIQTTNDFTERNNKPLTIMQNQSPKYIMPSLTPQEHASIVQIHDISYETNSRDQSILQSNILCIQKTKVLKQVKQYSPFTFQICKYLENNQQTRYLSNKQRDFIKNYLIVHIVENSIEKAIGLVDYFSNSLLELLCTPLDDFKVGSAQIK